MSQPSQCTIWCPGSSPELEVPIPLVFSPAKGGDAFLEATRGREGALGQISGTTAHVHQLCGLERLPDLSELHLPLL